MPKTCAGCGVENKIQAAQCDQCGRRFGPAEPKANWIKVGVYGFMAIIVVCVAFLALRPESTDDQPDSETGRVVTPLTQLPIPPNFPVFEGAEPYPLLDIGTAAAFSVPDQDVATVRAWYTAELKTWDTGRWSRCDYEDSTWWYVDGNDTTMLFSVEVANVSESDRTTLVTVQTGISGPCS